MAVRVVAEPSAEAATVERFLAAFSRIEAHLRREVKADKYLGFADLVARYDPRRTWRDREDMMLFADIRNLLAHRLHGLPAIPTASTIRAIEYIWARLNAPELVIPRFQRNVTRVSPTDTLVHVLDVVRKNDYSQFPVYRSDRFVGLITENGITRWMAHHVHTVDSIIDLHDVTVSALVKEEETSSNVSFIPRTSTVDAVLQLFADSPLLEAALITNAGQKTETPLGIITRWDIVMTRALPAHGRPNVHRSP
jgi:predicted transcriptional regulator